MDDTFWHKQTLENPLFEDLLWSRPQNRRSAGKLLIIGGNLHGFSSPVKAHAAAKQAGVGSCRVVLPDTLAKTVGHHFSEAEFSPATKVGSFGRQSLDTWLETAAWADGVLLAGDFGKNSETAILAESFLDKYQGGLTVSGDSLDYFTDSPDKLFNRKGALLVLSFSRLQKMVRRIQPQAVLKHDMSLLELARALSGLTGTFPAGIVTFHAGYLAAAVGGQVSTTPAKIPDDEMERLAAYVSVWQLQQPSQVFGAITTAVYMGLHENNR